MLIAGIAGWLLPVIPGWAFMIPGLVLLAREFHWARWMLDRLKRLYPHKTTER